MRTVLVWPKCHDEFSGVLIGHVWLGDVICQEFTRTPYNTLVWAQKVVDVTHVKDNG